MMWDREMEHSFSKSKSRTLLGEGGVTGLWRSWGDPQGQGTPKHPHHLLVDGVQVGAVPAALVLRIKAPIAHWGKGRC